MEETFDWVAWAKIHLEPDVSAAGEIHHKPVIKEQKQVHLFRVKYAGKSLRYAAILSEDGTPVRLRTITSNDRKRIEHFVDLNRAMDPRAEMDKQKEAGTWVNTRPPIVRRRAFAARGSR